uniref:NADH dehydrogenase subunit 6 n=1 Tax=Enoplolambrus validus TaxID=2969665 RepID=UPI0023F48E11|nr:NADH dehydrogenase subunit 6 [Enoplolambrus validus]WDV10171.1 NADH dehydrogenase subunit 6 [Enoplolambrus validus]
MIPIMMILSFLFTRLQHPLSMGLTLLIQTIVISLSSGLYTYSFWFSYILFMIFLGGMLVLFIYVASLASNEKFFFSAKNFFLSVFLWLTTSFMLIFLDSTLISNYSSLPSLSYTLISSTPLIINWIYNNSIMNFTLFIILYLLLTLIVVVKIVNMFKGPLRLSN